MSENNPFLDLPMQAGSEQTEANNPFMSLPMQSGQEEQSTAPQQQQPAAEKQGSSPLLGLQDVQQAQQLTQARTRGVGQGVREVGQGVGQAALAAGQQVGVVSPETRQQYDQNVMRQRAAASQGLSPEERGSFEAGRFVGNTAPYMAIPGAPQVGLLGRMLAGAATGATIGATQFVKPGQSRALNTGIGATLGGSLAGVLGGVPKAIRKGVFSNNIAAAEQRMKNLEGLNPTLGQITNKESIQLAESGLGKVPLVGLKKHFRTQTEKLVNRVQKTISKMNTGRNVDNASLGKGIKAAYEKAKVEADDAYKLFTEAANKTKSSIPLINIKQVASKKLNELKDLQKSGFSSVAPVKELRTIYQDLSQVNF